MNLSDIPIVGGFASAGVILVDLFVHSGDLIFVGILLAIEAAPMLLPLLTSIERLVDRIPFLEFQYLEWLIIATLVLLVLSYAIRLYRRFIQDNDS